MNSIRRRLLILLSGAFLLGWAGLALLIYAEARYETEEIYDAQLARFAGIILSIPMRDDTLANDLPHQDLVDVKLGHDYINHFSIQYWRGDRLAFHSQNIPDHRITHENGYSDAIIGDTRWRLFQTQTGSDGTLVVGEKYQVREELIGNITRDSIAPIIWTLPLVIFLLSLTIARGLKPLKTLSARVESLDPQELQPISVAHSPLEVRPLTQAINRLLMRLHHALEKEARFTADVSHELRTPLAGVRSQTQLALRHCSRPESISALNKALSGLDRCDRMVEQMLTLHRFNPERISEHFELVDIGKLACTVCEDLLPLAQQKSIRLIPPPESDDDPLLILGYAPGLYIMLKNIVENAIHYSPHHGEVNVTLCESGDDRVCLEVTDTGPGIPEECRHRVFNRFFRQPNNGVSGAGLGLSIVRQLADLHQAKIELGARTEGIGLRFTVHFALGF